jgi:hypothetical protein
LRSEAEKLEIAEEEGRNNDVWAGMEADDPELQAALIRAGAASGQSTETHCIIIVNSLGIIQVGGDQSWRRFTIRESIMPLKTC